MSMEINENRTFCANQFPRIMCDIAWNNPTFIVRSLSGRFLETFSPQYLATRGEESIIFLSTKNFGQFPSILYPFFLAGLACLLFLKRSTPFSLEKKLLIITGLLITPIPTILVGEAQKVR